MYFNSQVKPLINCNRAFKQSPSPGWERGPVRAAGVRLARVIKNSWKTCKAAQKAVSIMQCPPKDQAETIYPEILYKGIVIKALRYTQPCIVFRCFLAPREDSFARTVSYQYHCVG
jgi:hypothetical protein